MTRHCYLPTVILTDKGSQFRPDVVNQIAQALHIRISHALTKHAQTIGILERVHASLKTSLKISPGERCSMWHKDVQIAVMNYNTSYHENLGCEQCFTDEYRTTLWPSNWDSSQIGKKDANEDLTDELQKELAEILQAPKDNLMQSYLKYNDITIKKR